MDIYINREINIFDQPKQFLTYTLQEKRKEE